MRFERIGRALIVLCLLLALSLGALLPTEPACEIACVGDSITQGVGAEPEQSYPAYLQRLLGENVQVYNYGSNGRALLAASRHPYTREDCYRASLEQAADIYIIMLGSNDIWEDCWDEEDFAQELVQLVRAYQEVQREPCVYLVKPPEYFPSGQDMLGWQKRAYMTDLFEAIDAAAEQTGCQVMDLYSLTKDHPEWFSDEVHPNAVGNEKIAEYIYECIAQDIG